MTEYHPRPGRPRNKERRRLIVDVALKLFARNGYRGTTMREVARASGISDSLVFRYFPRKRDLLDAIAAEHQDELQRFVAALLRLARTAVDPATLLERASLLYAKYLKGTRSVYVLFLTGAPEVRDERDKAKAVCDRVIDLVASTIERIAPRQDASVDVRNVLRALHGAIFDAVFSRDADVDDYVKETARMTAKLITLHEKDAA